MCGGVDFGPGVLDSSGEDAVARLQLMRSFSIVCGTDRRMCVEESTSA